MRKNKRLVKEIIKLEDKYKEMPTEGLQRQTAILRQRYMREKSLRNLVIPAFAVAREADRRVLGMFPFPVQILGGLVLHQGNLAEMKTGEGKTLTETMPVYLNALTGKGVHVVTVNSYLSKRDADEMGKVFKFPGLTVGYNDPSYTHLEKRKAYAADILYSTNDELAFDYLRDNMCMSLKQKVQRGLNYAIVDEVDSILIDEAKTPLIISGQVKSHEQLYISADRFVKGLKKSDYDYDLENKVVTLSESGIEKANNYFGLIGLYDDEGLVLAHYINEALKANTAMVRDIDYVIKDNDVVLIDQFTGRTMPERRFADGLHQAIEAKEGVPIRQANQTQASITYQNFFRMYQKLAGMTGTAKNEATEFYQNYQMKVRSIPTNKPSRRKDYPDSLYVSEASKLQAVLRLVKQVHKKGQPILLGTGSVENSYKLHYLLLGAGLKHNVLNAKNNAAEAQIIALAGQRGAITVATNMAGRGTDIKLGDGVAKLGGLFVIGTEKHESRRIDDQLRGRAGRQGDPGASQFFVSFEDELMKRFASDHLRKIHEELVASGDEGKPIRSRLAHRWILDVQKRVEGSNADERRNILLFDDVLQKERVAVYKQRDLLLSLNDPKDLQPLLLSTFAKSIDRNVNYYRDMSKEGNQRALETYIANTIGARVNKKKLRHVDMLTLKKSLLSFSTKQLALLQKKLDDDQQINEFESVIMLKAIDEAWMENLDDMEQLRLSILLQNYGQHNPLVEYQRKAHEMYVQMANSILDNITRNILLAEIKEEGGFNVTDV